MTNERKQAQQAQQEQEDQSKPETAPETEGFITKEEVARRLKKTVRTVEIWQKKGALPYVKVGQSVLFRWPAVEAHLEANFGICNGANKKGS